MRKITTYILMVAMLSGWACNNEVDLTADYKDIPVVYCMLDPMQPRQVLRIQKAYLVDGDITQGVKIKDSTTYNPADIDVKVFAVNNVGQSVDSLPFVYDPTITLQEGMFPKDAASFYTCHTPLMHNRYRLVLTNKKRNEKHTAETIIVRNMKWEEQEMKSPIDFTDTAGVKLVWKTDTTASLYQPRIILYWKEVDLVTYQSTPDSMIWDLAPFNANSTYPSMLYILPPGGFISQVAGTVPAKPEVKRVIESVTFDIYGATKDFSIYYFTNSTSIGLIQDKPKYSNISGGLGVFASKNRGRLSNLKLKQPTVSKLLALGLGFSE